MNHYLVCTRNIKGQGAAKKFGNEPGAATYLIVPDTEATFSPAHIEGNKDRWLAKMLAGREGGLRNILVYIHGYNMDIEMVLQRHKFLKQNLQKQNWDGELVTFAWPSSDKPLLYWEDRFDGMAASRELVSSCLRLFADQGKKGCTMNVHFIVHSTGALILREAFTYAQTTTYANENWAASQLVFVAGDVSSSSMDGSYQSEAVYKHCARLTNYFSNHDSILAISNAKRVGIENRVGRVGLPHNSPQKGVDINCSDYYRANEDTIRVDPGIKKPHAWYFWSDRFMEDLVHTLRGELDRGVIPSRELRGDGELYLKI